MRFKGLDLNLLLTLKVLLEEKSVSDAALKLNVTQPAVSAALRKLREYFKDELLILNGKKMLLTAHAAQLMPELSALLSDIDVFISKTTHFAAESSARVFKIAANDYFCSIILAPVLTSISRIAPSVTVDVLPISKSVYEDLNRGELDLIFSPRTTLDSEFEIESLYREDLVAILCKNNKRVGARLSLEQLRCEPQVLVDLGGLKKETMLRQSLSKLNVGANEVLSLPSFLAAPHVIQNSDLLAIVHRRLAENIGEYLPIRIAELPHELRSQTAFDYCALFHTARKNDEGLQWLLSMIRDYTSRTKFDLKERAELKRSAKA